MPSDGKSSLCFWQSKLQKYLVTKFNMDLWIHYIKYLVYFILHAFPVKSSISSLCYVGENGILFKCSHSIRICLKVCTRSHTKETSLRVDSSESTIFVKLQPSDIITYRYFDSNFYFHFKDTLPTKFQFIWESGFREEDFLEINQSETRMTCGGHVC